MGTLNAAASERQQGLRQIKASLLEQRQQGSTKGRSGPASQHLRDRQTSRSPLTANQAEANLGSGPLSPVGGPGGSPRGPASQFSGLSSTVSGALSMSMSGRMGTGVGAPPASWTRTRR